MKQYYNVEAIKKSVEFFGSIHQFSIALNTTYGTVLKWVHGKGTPSPLSCIKIEKATKGEVKKEDIRPDFDWKNFKKLI